MLKELMTLEVCIYLIRMDICKDFLLVTRQDVLMTLRALLVMCFLLVQEFCHGCQGSKMW